MVARKSRKNIVAGEAIYRDQTCIVAGYVRLSVVKEGRPYDSIETQSALIEDFVDKTRGEMLSDIENGTINCVVTKDLSRLGRNFLETGYYIEQYFPIKDVRFISIADDFETTNGLKNNKRRESMNNIRIPMTNLFNEKYVEDIKSKTQSTIDCMIRHGKYVAPRAPYGYTKNPADCHALIVDPEAAAVVKDIFAMADQGVGLNEIVRHLNGAKILPPLEYAKANGLEGNYEQGSGLWNTRSVKKILTNCVYVGDLMQGKENYLVKDTHEALVNREIFVRIQWTFSKSAEANKAKSAPISDNPLKGKVICGCCGGKMQRRRGSGNANWYFFTCITNNRLGSGNCTGMYIRESAIMDAIKTEIDKYVEGHCDIEQNYKQDKAVLDEKLAEAKHNLDIQVDRLQHSFEQNYRGLTSQEGFEQVVAEKRNADQAVRAVEINIGQLDEAYQTYQLFCRAESNNEQFSEIISVYLQSVDINGTCSLQIHWIEQLTKESNPDALLSAYYRI